jgi:hypothetical protein
MITRPEEELMLLSAGTSARRAVAAGRSEDLLARVDWRRLTAMLRELRLLPTLGPRVLLLAGPRAPDELRETVEQAIASAARHGAFLELVSSRVVAALAEAGIRSSPLKGPQLGEAIYGQPGRRLSSDVDLLVAPEELAAAVEVVRSLGYRAPRDHLQVDGLPSLHWALAHERGELPLVELHWRIHWYERDFAQERLLPPTLDLLGQWRPERSAQLTALLLFYARDGFIGLRLASDLAAWWDAFATELPAAALQQLLGSYPALRRPVLAASIVAERMVGLCATQILAPGLAPGLRERVALRMANPHPRASRAQLYADAGLIDCLLAPPGGVRDSLRRQLLLPRAVRVDRARHAGGRRAISSVGHAARVLARYALAIVRLASRRC